MSEGIGAAGSIRVKHIPGSEDLTDTINDWLSKKHDADVIDIKFATSATQDEYASDVLIIYRWR